MTNQRTSGLAGLWPVLAIISIIIIMTFTCSCESKSGQLNKTPLERVVVLDSRTETAYDNDYKYYITSYKVKRIELGVVDWITFNGKPMYECGDTIFYRFILTGR